MVRFDRLAVEEERVPVRERPRSRSDVVGFGECRRVRRRVHVEQQAMTIEVGRRVGEEEALKLSGPIPFGRRPRQSVADEIERLRTLAHRAEDGRLRRVERRPRGSGFLRGLRLQFAACQDDTLLPLRFAAGVGGGAGDGHCSEDDTRSTPFPAQGIEVRMCCSSFPSVSYPMSVLTPLAEAPRCVPVAVCRSGVMGPSRPRHRAGGRCIASNSCYPNAARPSHRRLVVLHRHLL